MSNKNSKSSGGNKRVKHKLQAMDIVTMIFTAVIVGIMIFVVYDQFAGRSGNGNNSNSTANPTNASSPTSTPTLSDIGNIYGNITNDASVVVIDKREYFISSDDNKDKHIWVKVGDTTKDLIKTNASSLNVVTDYLTYADQKDVTAYYVFYINGDGKICYVSDGPVGTNLEEKSNLEEKVFLDGKFMSINVSGQYVYYLNEEGQVGRASILTKKTDILSSEHKYKSFVLYYGTIYGLSSDDSKIYAFSSVPSTNSPTATPAATPTASTTVDPSASPEAPKPKETLMVSKQCNGFVVDNYWIYVMTDDGIIRYISDQTDKADTISSEKTDALNVYKGAIFYIKDGDLYSGSAESIITGTVDKIGTVAGAKSINISADSVYIVNESGKLMKSTYDKDSGKYSDFKAMN